jgi:hypothetical protein
MNVRQTALLFSRLLRRALRNPAATLPNLLISLFFLLVYQGLLGHASAVARLVGGNYVNFILPVSILSASVSGGTAGLILVSDAESGYLRRLLAMPISRAAIVIAPILLGALQVLIQALLLLAVGALIGADPRTGAGTAGLRAAVGPGILRLLGGHRAAHGQRADRPDSQLHLLPTDLPRTHLPTSQPALTGAARNRAHKPHHLRAGGDAHAVDLRLARRTTAGWPGRWRWLCGAHSAAGSARRQTGDSPALIRSQHHRL